MHNPETYDRKTYLAAVREMREAPENQEMFRELKKDKIAEVNQIRIDIDKACRIAIKQPELHIEYFISHLKRKVEKLLYDIKYLTNRPKRTNKEFDLEKIKENNDPETILGRAKFRTNLRYKFLCPAHSDHDPSFVWYRKNNSGYCFVCGFSGDIISVLMKLEGCTFVEACKRLS